MHEGIAPRAPRAAAGTVAVVLDAAVLDPKARRAIAAELIGDAAPAPVAPFESPVTRRRLGSENSSKAVAEAATVSLDALLRSVMDAWSEHEVRAAEEDHERMAALFNEHDEDGNGALTYGEYCALISSLGLPEDDALDLYDEMLALSQAIWAQDADGARRAGYHLAGGGPAGVDALHPKAFAQVTVKLSLALRRSFSGRRRRAAPPTRRSRLSCGARRRCATRGVGRRR